MLQLFHTDVNKKISHSIVATSACLLNEKMECRVFKSQPASCSRFTRVHYDGLYTACMLFAFVEGMLLMLRMTLLKLLLFMDGLVLLRNCTCTSCYGCSCAVRQRVSETAGYRKPVANCLLSSRQAFGKGQMHES